MLSWAFGLTSSLPLNHVVEYITSPLNLRNLKHFRLHSAHFMRMQEDAGLNVF